MTSIQGVMAASAWTRTRRRPTALALLSSLLVALTLVVAGPSDAATSTPDSIAFSFPSAQRGFVLSLNDCHTNTCASLRTTDDAGASWVTVPVPVALNKALSLDAWGSYASTDAPLSVHFANATDGWLYGTLPAPATSRANGSSVVTRLWSTHDGGATWRRIRLGSYALTGGVIQMATHGALTYLYGASFLRDRSYLLATPSHADRWTSRSTARLGVPAGGTQLEADFTFAGARGWFVAGNDRGFTASARLLPNGSWAPWTGPSFARFGAGYTPLSVVSPRVLLSEAQSSGFTSPPPATVPPGWTHGAAWLFISYDAGATFEALERVSSSYQGATTLAGLPASPVPGTIILERASPSGYRLLRSTDWGHTWQVVLSHYVDQVTFASHATGFALVQVTSSATYVLYRTLDAGAHWSPVSF